MCVCKTKIGKATVIKQKLHKVRMMSTHKMSTDNWSQYSDFKTRNNKNKADETKNWSILLVREE